MQERKRQKQKNKLPSKSEFLSYKEHADERREYQNHDPRLLCSRLVPDCVEKLERIRTIGAGKLSKRLTTCEGEINQKKN
jgi:ribosome assembly protein YihI (activator of Der GTPase)